MEGRPFAVTPNRDGSLMRLDHGLADGQPEAGPIRFTVRHEWFENARQKLSWNAATCIRNFKACARFDSFDAKSQHLSIVLFHGLARIADQVAENAHEAVPIDMQPTIVKHLDAHIDVMPAFRLIGL